MTVRCLVTGATGYIGGRLVPELLAAGHAGALPGPHAGPAARPCPGPAHVEVVAGDADATPDDAARPRSTASTSRTTWSTRSGTGATSRTPTGAAAQRLRRGRRARPGCGRIVYLGGPDPAPAASELSPHLRSRAEVGRILLAAGVPTVVLRAAVIIGSGSASFEMLRYLTERLPVMVTPRWVRTRIQPIAVRDVLRYLVGCADAAGRRQPRPSTSAARTC